MNLDAIQKQRDPIAIVGLGYVGLPLACLLAEKFKVVGFDINQSRVSELRDGHDRTREVEDKNRLLNANLSFTADPTAIKDCSLVIVAVPTPVDQFKQPDLAPVRAASRTVGKNLRKGAVVCFESTVYPGVTEDVCGTILAEESGLTCGEDFFLGYSPERVNPGDKEHTIDKIVKVVAGQTSEVRDFLCAVYGSVVKAGVHPAANIKTAEAAKVIENTQRDINIALINELCQIFDYIGLDTLDVLEAAGTKWNFLPFRPGLVGGHCIGVDPYYLTYLAEGLGFHPQIISAGRRINDGMAQIVADKTLRLILGAGEPIKPPVKVGIYGVTFKEDVPDTRNTKVIDVAQKLEAAGVKTYLIDPVADPQEFEEEYGRSLICWEDLPACDALILAVKHDVLKDKVVVDKLLSKLNGKKIVLDLKGMVNRKEAEKVGIKLWRL